jgi:hypothetical protein
MSKTFAERASLLAGLSAKGLGWRPNEFWSATPADLALAMSDGGDGSAPPTHDEIRRLIEQDETHG